MNGTLEHLIMGIIFTFISMKMYDSPIPAIAIMFTVEAVQYDILGMRLLDTAHDLVMDGVGVFLVITFNF